MFSCSNAKLENSIKILETKCQIYQNDIAALKNMVVILREEKQDKTKPKQLLNKTTPKINKARHSIISYSGVCGARTKKGGICHRKVKGGGRCFQH